MWCKSWMLILMLILNHLLPGALPRHHRGQQAAYQDDHHHGMVHHLRRTLKEIPIPSDDAVPLITAVSAVSAASASESFMDNASKDLLLQHLMEPISDWSEYARLAPCDKPLLPYVICVRILPPSSVASAAPQNHGSTSSTVLVTSAPSTIRTIILPSDFRLVALPM